MKGRLKKILLIIVLLVNIGLQTVSAQQETLPLAGPFSYHLASGIQLRESLITATTIGGVLGYGLGIYLVVSGLSFDKTYLLELPAPKFQAQQLNSTPFQTEMLPLVAQSAKYDHTKWELPIYTFRF